MPATSLIGSPHVARSQSKMASARSGRSGRSIRLPPLSAVAVAGRFRRGDVGIAFHRLEFHAFPANFGDRAAAVILLGGGAATVVTAPAAAAANVAVGAAVTRPVITAQPSNRTASADKQARFAVSARGTGLRYQWQQLRRGNWTSLSGKIKPVLLIGAVPSRNGAYYRVVIKNSGRVVSHSAKLTVVVGKPRITTQPRYAWIVSGHVATGSRRCDQYQAASPQTVTRPASTAAVVRDHGSSSRLR
jgi:hypothetical protein